MELVTVTPSATMISITTLLLSVLLASVSGAAVPSSQEVDNAHTRQVQELLNTINSMVRQEVSDLGVGRHMMDQESKEGFLRESPRAKGGQEARGARQAGEMIGSLLGSGLDEVLATVSPVVSDIFGPFMTRIGLTLLEWFSYIDPQAKAAVQENDSKTKTQNIYDAFEVDFPEYGKFLVLSERKDGFDDGNNVFQGQKVEDDVDSVDADERQGLASRNLERLDSRDRWIEDRDMHRRFQLQ